MSLVEDFHIKWILHHELLLGLLATYPHSQAGSVPTPPHPPPPQKTNLGAEVKLAPTVICPLSPTTHSERQLVNNFAFQK